MSVEFSFQKQYPQTQPLWRAWIRELIVGCPELSVACCSRPARADLQTPGHRVPGSYLVILRACTITKSWTLKMQA